MPLLRRLCCFGNTFLGWSQPPLRILSVGVRRMKRKQQVPPSLRVEPEKRLCPKFDEESIARFPVARRDEMGLRVLDDCAEEHIM